LADVLDYLEARQTFADSVDDVLVDAAGVLADTLMENLIINVTLRAFSAVSVNGHVANFAVTVSGFQVEDLIGPAAITQRLATSVDFDWGWFTTGAVIVIPTVSVVVGEGANCKQ